MVRLGIGGVYGGLGERGHSHLEEEVEGWWCL